MKTKDLTQKMLKAYLTYDPISGIFNAKHCKKRGILLPAGRELGGLNNRGYEVIYINGVSFYAHRLAWLFVYGSMPAKPLMLDHIDRNKTNNAIDNLRIVNHRENMRNTGIAKNNTSGHTGVCFNKLNSKWWATITINKKEKYLGYHETKEEAAKARKQAEIKYRFYEVKERVS